MNKVVSVFVLWRSSGWVRVSFPQSRTDGGSSESHPPPQFTSSPRSPSVFRLPQMPLSLCAWRPVRTSAYRSL